jgi:hypothetical protein
MGDKNPKNLKKKKKTAEKSPAKPAAAKPAVDTGTAKKAAAVTKKGKS